MQNTDNHIKSIRIKGWLDRIANWIFKEARQIEQSGDNQEFGAILKEIDQAISIVLWAITNFNDVTVELGYAQNGVINFLNDMYNRFEKESPILWNYTDLPDVIDEAVVTNVDETIVPEIAEASPKIANVILTLNDIKQELTKMRSEYLRYGKSLKIARSSVIKSSIDTFYSEALDTSGDVIEVTEFLDKWSDFDPLEDETLYRFREEYSEEMDELDELWDELLELHEENHIGIADQSQVSQQAQMYKEQVIPVLDDFIETLRDYLDMY